LKYSKLSRRLTAMNFSPATTVSVMNRTFNVLESFQQNEHLCHPPYQAVMSDDDDRDTVRKILFVHGSWPKKSSFPTSNYITFYNRRITVNALVSIIVQWWVLVDNVMIPPTVGSFWKQCGHSDALPDSTAPPVWFELSPKPIYTISWFPLRYSAMMQNKTQAWAAVRDCRSGRCLHVKRCQSFLQHLHRFYRITWECKENLSSRNVKIWILPSTNSIFDLY
jgi:hypothetical protein